MSTFTRSLLPADWHGLFPLLALKGPGVTKPTCPLVTDSFSVVANLLPLLTANFNHLDSSGKIVKILSCSRFNSYSWPALSAVAPELPVCGKTSRSSRSAKWWIWSFLFLLACTMFLFKAGKKTGVRIVPVFYFLSRFCVFLCVFGSAEIWDAEISVRSQKKGDGLAAFVEGSICRDVTRHRLL